MHHFCYSRTFEKAGQKVVSHIVQTEMETGSVDDYNAWANECAQHADSATKKVFEGLVVEEEGHLDQFETEIENLEKGGPIAIADYFIINDGSLEQLHQKIDAATHDAHFCKSPEQC